VKRREFFKTAGAAGVGSAALGAAPVRKEWLMSTTETAYRGPEPSAFLVSHCRRILDQNLLKAGETFILTTPMVYDVDYMQAMLVAAGEIGATGMHVAVISHDPTQGRDQGRLGPSPGAALTPVHWNLYAEADLLINSSLGSAPGLPSPTTAYNVKVGDHPYRSDSEYINRPGSKTRWLNVGYDLGRQQRYFPTAERRERTLRGARLLDEARGEIRVTNEAGSDWTCSGAGRPGHAQYGIADFPGRWDNFGYGCVAYGPVEDSADGVLVFKPGDIIRDIYPNVLREEVRVTFQNGYVTGVEGGSQARQWQEHLSSFDHREAWGLAHFGWGTHEKTQLSSVDDIGHYHHNLMGSLLYSLGMNFAHGMGGPDAGYSGLGATARIAPNHSHYAMFDCDVYVDGNKVIEQGRCSPEAGGIA
jgi:hypothetical protein